MSKLNEVVVPESYWHEIEADENQPESIRISATIMAHIRKYILDADLTRSEAAKLFKVESWKIVSLLEGDMNPFNLDILTNMLAAADMRVRLYNSALDPRPRVSED